MGGADKARAEVDEFEFGGGDGGVAEFVFEALDADAVESVEGGEGRGGANMRRCGSSSGSSGCEGM